jgi:hypothetical protein
MMRIWNKPVLWVAFLAWVAAPPAVLAQKWEIGGGIGGSFYTTQTVTNVAATADAGLAKGLAASFLLGNNSGNLLGGDLRYDYERPNLSLKSGGTSASFNADTHAIHYDFLLHFAPRGSRVRPFVSGGGGVKVYRGTGKETAFQPLSNLAFLTKTSELKPLVSVGGGIKFAISRAFQVRLEVRDALTPFPKNVIAPAQGSKVGGWLQDLTAMVGLSITF